MFCKVKAKTKIRAHTHPIPEGKKRNHCGYSELSDTTNIVSPANVTQKRHPKHLISIKVCHQQKNKLRSRADSWGPAAWANCGRAGARRQEAPKSPHSLEARKTMQGAKKLKALVNVRGSPKTPELSLFRSLGQGVLRPVGQAQGTSYLPSLQYCTVLWSLW